LKNTDGVVSVKILFNASKAKIEYDENITNKDLIIQTIDDLGYDVLNIL